MVNAKSEMCSVERYCALMPIVWASISLGAGRVETDWAGVGLRWWMPGGSLGDRPAIVGEMN